MVRPTLSAAKALLAKKAKADATAATLIDISNLFGTKPLYKQSQLSELRLNCKVRDNQRFSQFAATKERKEDLLQLIDALYVAHWPG